MKMTIIGTFPVLFEITYPYSRLSRVNTYICIHASFITFRPKFKSTDLDI